VVADSKWIAYDKQSTSTFSAVYLYSLESKQITAVTSDLVNSQLPIWIRRASTLLPFRPRLQRGHRRIRF